MGIFRFIIQACKVVIYAAVVVGVVEVWDFVKKTFHIRLDQTSISEIAKKGPEIKKESEATLAQKPTSPKDTEKNLEKAEESEKSKEEVVPLITFEKGFENIAKQTKDSVVSIAVAQLVEDEPSDIPDLFGGSPFDDFFRDFFSFPGKRSKPKKVQALGSGFIIRVDKDKMYIVTNNHVVEKAKKIAIYLADKTELLAELHASDPRTDLAVISVNLKGIGIDRKKLKPMTWGNSDDICEGNFVIAIGNPFGFGSTVTSGIISSKGRNVSFSKPSLSLVDDFIQHSAPINMGSSGGCLLDIKGKVIGVNNAIITPNGGNIGIGFAIPSNIARVTVEQLIEHKRTFRGWLGVEVQKVDQKVAAGIGLIGKESLSKSQVLGAYVSKIVPGGPAEKAGIHTGDVITAIGGKKITAENGVQQLVSNTPIGQSTTIDVWRHVGGKEWKAVRLTVKIGDFEEALRSGSLDSEDAPGPADADQNNTAVIPALGITVATIPPRYRNDYPPEVKVIITQVEDTTEASLFGGSAFIQGDGIVSVDGIKIISVQQLKEIIESLAREGVRTPIPIAIVRGKTMVMVAVTLDLSAPGAEKPTTKGDGKLKK
ncbi:MAG: trypsin-like peptidase domain-containing protein [Holosporales bacterium]|jgi:serine protease Do|nr:trypsin-like peptidase domain-containing protein [Holosporales bacterium]